MKNSGAAGVLSKYIPKAAIPLVIELLKEHRVYLKLKAARSTKWGDFYNEKRNGYYYISVNRDLNQYQFLMTLIHELAHLTTLEKYGPRVPHHGKEWKSEFTKLMQPFLSSEFFPQDLLLLMKSHMRNPKAAATTDVALFKKLDSYTQNDSMAVFVEDLKPGESFVYKSREFKRGKKIKKRILCTQVATKRQFLFSPIARVQRTERTKYVLN